MLQRIVRVSCPDRPGLVSAITTAFALRGLNIHQLDQFTNDGSFFVRSVIEAPAADGAPSSDPGSGAVSGAVSEASDDAFAGLDEALREALPDAVVEVRPYPADQRIVVLASTTDHCLQEMIRRAQTGQLGGHIVKVVANHDVHRQLCEFHGIPFEVVPHEGVDKAAHEDAVLAAIGDDVDVVVLARYMRILSDEFLQRAPAPIINIHHSFLPSFIGANPYQRAHDRGVKMIGATAHYVTADLDEGPIIEQDVTRVHHGQSKPDLVQAGADVERTVLHRAVQAHCEGRIFLDGDRTVVFSS